MEDQGRLLRLRVLSILLAVVLWQESRAADGLARYIPLYPSTNGVTWVPQIPGNNSRHWMFTTADLPAVVARFYADPNHHPGWTLEEMAGSFLILKKGSQCLQIMIARDLNVLSRGKTTIMYTLENECT